MSLTLISDDGDVPFPVKDVFCSGQEIWFITATSVFRALYDSKEQTLTIRALAKLLPELGDKLRGRAPNYITGNGKGAVWVSTKKGICEISTSPQGALTLTESLPCANKADILNSKFVSQLFYKNGQLWVLSNSTVQVYSVSEDNKIKTLYKSINLFDIVKTSDGSKFNFNASKLWLDSKNSLWVATFGGIICIEEPISKHITGLLYEHSAFDHRSLLSNKISSLFEDKSRCLWIGTWGAGVNIIDLEQKKFNLLRKTTNSHHSLVNEFVRAIEEDSWGNIWIGTEEGGINVFDPKTEKIDEIALNNADNTAIRTLKAHGGYLYVGTEKKNLYQLDIQTKKVRFLTGSNVNFYDLETDHTGNLWGVGWGGILRCDFSGSTPEFTEYSTVNKLLPTIGTDNFNNVIYKSKERALYISSQTGIHRLQLGEDGDIALDDGGNPLLMSFLKDKYVWPLLSGNDTVLWAGTFGSGLYKIIVPQMRQSKAKIAGHIKACKLQGNDIESMEFDTEGNIWIGGYGLTKFAPDEETFLNFDVNDGLQSNGFKIGSSLAADDGTLYFGGVMGLNYFRPAEIKPNKIKPRVSITSLEINGSDISPNALNTNDVEIKKGIPYQSEIELKHSDNNLKISFSSLHFANPGKCTYEYRLAPYEKEWQSTDGGFPFAVYSKLPPGHYTFKVKGTNNDGIPSAAPASLLITVRKPWWASILAYAVYSLFLMGLVGLFYYYISRWIKMRQNLKILAAEEQKKEELHQHKLQFFTNITHEIKTPLTLISAPLEKLYNDEKPSGERKHLFKLILSNTKRLLTLTNELVAFRKTDIGKSYLHTTNMKLSSLTKKIVKQFQNFASQKNISLNFELLAEEKIWIDEGKTTMIIHNLILNALKYNVLNGKVEVRIYRGEHKDVPQTYKYSYAEFSDKTEGPYVFLSVTDTGLGVSENSIKRIFDRFYHEGHNPEEHLGSGIGLALVKNLILLHGGSIFVSSKRPGGTQFVLGFPTGDKHLKPEEKTDESLKDSLIDKDTDHLYEESQVSVKEDDEGGEDTKASVLLIEDNEELRAMLRGHFQGTYTVLEAANGKKGVEMGLEFIPNLIISDLMMPEMDGFEACKQFRENINTSHIPIILLTAMSSVDNQIKGTEYGADVYITKPFSLKLLDAKVNRMLETADNIKRHFSNDINASVRDLAKNQRDRDFMEKLEKLVEEHMIEEGFSINDLGAIFGMGRTSFYKKIKSVTGQSPVEFSRNLRLKKAAKMLLTEDVTISEVIFRVGIQTNSYFTKAFKAQFNMTPSEFVRQNSKKE